MKEIQAKIKELGLNPLWRVSWLIIEHRSNDKECPAYSGESQSPLTGQLVNHGYNFRDKKIHILEQSQSPLTGQLVNHPWLKVVEGNIEWVESQSPLTGQLVNHLAIKSSWKAAKKSLNPLWRVSWLIINSDRWAAWYDDELMSQSPLTGQLVNHLKIIIWKKKL